MNRLFRATLGVVFASLALAGTAQAQAELIVIPFSTALGRSADTEFDLSLPANAAPTQRVEVYVPAGYQLAVPAPGARVGTGLIAFGSASTPTRATGTVTADDPARHAANTCAPGTHTGVWVLSVTQPQAITVPIYVDPTAGTEATLGAYKLTACFGADIVAGAAGSKLRAFEIDVLTAFTNPSRAGLYRWRALVTPYAAGNAAPDPAQQFELRSIAILPQRIVLRGRYDRRTRRVVLTGRVTAPGGTGRNPLVVDIYSARNARAALRTFGRARAGRGGAFTFRKRITQTTFFIGVIDVYFGRCTGGASVAPRGCTRETTSPAFSNPVRVAVRRGGR